MKQIWVDSSMAVRLWTIIAFSNKYKLLKKKARMSCWDNRYKIQKNKTAAIQANRLGKSLTPLKE